MGNGNHLDATYNQPVHDHKREPVQKESASTVQIWWIPIWPLSNHVNGVIKLTAKPVCRRHTQLTVPLTRFFCFVKCRREEGDRDGIHSSEKRRWRTTDQGTGVTLPVSASAMRRAISADH